MPASHVYLYVSTNPPPCANVSPVLLSCAFAFVGLLVSDCTMLLSLAPRRPRRRPAPVTAGPA